jgi:two-component system alkaline phosphatase synthesis response regulator PhoP
VSGCDREKQGAKDNQVEKRILVIEDDRHIAEGLELNLSLKGHQVRIARDGGRGLREWREWRPHLIVLDIMLPGIDGLNVLRNIRLEDEKLPILILSAKATVDDKIKGLTYGVDDYLTKPFNLEEFLLRVDRLLARGHWQQHQGALADDSPGATGQVYSFGNNRVDLSTATAECQLGRISLTGQEVRLLKLFFANRGKVLSRRELLEIGWGYTSGTSSRTLDNFIVRFRKYFEENPHQPRFFKSRRAVGYLFEDPGAEGR